MEVVMMALFFFGIPLSFLGYFFISLYRFLTGRKQNQREPDSVPPEEMKNRKYHLIVSSVLALVIDGAALAFYITISLAIAYM